MENKEKDSSIFTIVTIIDEESKCPNAKNNYKLPFDERQTYQIGDICKIVHADNSFCFPPIKDEEAFGYGHYVMIVGSYWQCCGSCGKWFDRNNNFVEVLKNLDDYSVIVPKELNEKLYNANGDYAPNSYALCSGEYGWSWVANSQLEFVRHPTKKEKEKALNEYWNKIEKNGRAFGWDDVAT